MKTSFLKRKESEWEELVKTKLKYLTPLCMRLTTCKDWKNNLRIRHEFSSRF